MTDLVNADELVAQMRAAMAITLRETIAGLPADQAFQAGDRLCELWKETLAGMAVRFPALPRIDPAAIAADWAAGRSLAEVMKRNQCSKSAAYKHHPSKRTVDA